MLEADDRRYLFEIGYSESAMPFLQLALELVENLSVKNYSDDYGQNEQVLLADVLFCLSALAADRNQAADTLAYAQRHFDVRMALERKKISMGRHAGLAYTELGLGLLLNDRYQEPIDRNRAGKALLVGLPSFKEGKSYPDFAVIHDVLALIGLDRDDEAIPLLEEAIRFREKRFVPNDTQSFK